MYYFYNFELASVIRFTGGNDTASHLDVDAILHKLRGFCLHDDIYQHIKRALTIGCQAYSNAESSLENFILRVWQPLFHYTTYIICS